MIKNIDRVKKGPWELIMNRMTMHQAMSCCFLGLCLVVFMGQVRTESSVVRTEKRS